MPFLVSFWPVGGVPAVLNNPSTGNFQRLVLHTITLLQDAKHGQNRRSAANALRLLSTVLGLAAEAEAGSAAVVCALFDVPSAGGLPVPPQLLQEGVGAAVCVVGGMRRAMDEWKPDAGWCRGGPWCIPGPSDDWLGVRFAKGSCGVGLVCA